MLKHCWIIIAILISCMAFFTGCQRGQKMMDPVLSDGEPEMVDPPVEPTVEPEIPGVADQTELPIVSIDPAEIVSPSVGEQFTININIAGGKGVAGYEIHVSFDPNALKYISSANADYLPAGAHSIPADLSENTLIVAAADPLFGMSDGDGTLVTVTFEVVEAKASTIGLARVFLADPTAMLLENTTADGMVTAP